MFGGFAKERHIPFVNQQLGTGRRDQKPVGPDMIEMSVGVDDGLQMQAFLLQKLKDSLPVITGIDDHRLPGFGTGDDETVDLQRSDRDRFDQHSYNFV